MSKDIPPAGDYAVAFVDLLGQKDAMNGRHLPEDAAEAIKIIKGSVGKILSTQELVQNFLEGFTSADRLYSHLPPEMQEALPDMAPGELKWQRFSDGFVIYVPLGNGVVKSPASSLFALLMAAGTHCLIGLAGKSPLRVGIDVGWAVEPEPNEIYGAAVAYAHHMESQVAKWPRVVVGEGLIGYLHHCVATATDDLSGQARKLMATTCLSVLAQDTDGVAILDYLGPNFRRAAGNVMKPEVVAKAQEFIAQQLAHWQELGKEDLVVRYREVSSYFSSRWGSNAETRA